VEKGRDEERIESHKAALLGKAPSYKESLHHGKDKGFADSKKKRGRLRGKRDVVLKGRTGRKKSCAEVVGERPEGGVKET